MKVGIIAPNYLADKLPDNINTYEINSIKNYFLRNGVDCEVVDYRFEGKLDKILVMNYFVNFYGGENRPELIENVKWLAKQQNIYYIFLDYKIPLKQLFPIVSKKKFFEDLNLKEEEVFYTPKIISQFRDIEKVKLKNKVEEVRYLPLANHNLVKEEVENIGEYDLVYLGSYRAGSRHKKMLDYFFNRDLKILTTLPLDKFEYEKAPEVTNKISPEKILETNAKGLCTIILPETHYNDNVITLRILEGLLSNQIIFIDEKFDSKKTIFDDDFLYVKNGDELEERIKLLKEDKELFERLKASMRRGFEKIKEEGFKLIELLKEF